MKDVYTGDSVTSVTCVHIEWNHVSEGAANFEEIFFLIVSSFNLQQSHYRRSCHFSEFFGPSALPSLKQYRYRLYLRSPTHLIPSNSLSSYHHLLGWVRYARPAKLKLPCLSPAILLHIPVLRRRRFTLRNHHCLTPPFIRTACNPCQ